jgi:hypothetical protein
MENPSLPNYYPEWVDPRTTITPEIEETTELLDKRIAEAREAFLGVHMRDNKFPYLK